MKNNLTYLFIVFLILIFIRVGLGFDGLYGQDSYEYLRFSKSLKLFLETGTNPGDYFWPVDYPLSGAILSFIIPNSNLALQIISIFSLAMTGIYIHKTIELLYKKSNYTLIYVLLLFVFSPTVFKLGTLVMSDLLSTLFITLCCYHCLKYYKFESIKSLYFAVIFGVSALMTRYACFVVLLPFAGFLIYLLIRRKHLKYILPLFLIAALFALPHLYIKSNNPVAFINHSWLQGWSFQNFFQNSFTTIDGNAQNYFMNIFYAFSNVFHPRYFLFGTLLLIGFCLHRNHAKFQSIYIVSIVLYALFLAGVPFQNNRFLLLSFPLLIIVLFPSFEWLLTKISNQKLQNLILAFIMTIQLALCWYAMKPVLELNQFEKQIAVELKPYQKKTLYSFDIDIALQGRGLQFNYQNLWLKKYPSFDENALVLFNPEKFSKQWKGKNPMLNWTNLQKNYELKTLKKLSQGWFLYEISTAK